MYKWPLNIDNFSQEDKENISRFILNSKKWTQDNQVKIFEQKFAEYIGTKYAVFVCNGSAANTIIAHCIKDLYSEPSKNIVVLPSTTWQTSCSPWIREGFQPVFIDISLKNFSIHQELLEDYISKNYHSIACVFPTSLIGYSPNMDFFTYLQNTYNIKIMFDNCENTLGSFNNKNISSYFTSTTSTYFGHQIQSVEGGFIFTNDDIEYEYMLMLRNHGLTRSLKSYNLDYQHYQNNQVDNLFDFYCLGSNYRNTDINAFIGQLDFKKIHDHIEHRQQIYNMYYKYLDKDKFYLPSVRNNCNDVPFCLPIICRNANLKAKAIDICNSLSIEYRPIISGFLGYQTCYKKYFNTLSKENFVNSIFLHENGFYIGLHSGVSSDDILFITSQLNNI